ncbi:MAG: hypothetical protein JO036_18110 [Candidatus Eremiobacteraeota bacterium]|nr:hypothetical protein [Candidatus Eremiobacteraeota bacterium]
MSKTVYELKYRLLEKGVEPRPIRLAVPGWGGEDVKRANGAVPQPWHCVPFLAGASYGLELVYDLDAECRVGWDGGQLRFLGDFSKPESSRMAWPPFRSISPNHYSLGTMVDLQVPEGYSLRVEPHPSFFNDTTASVPAAVIGNLETSWWPMFFFVTFKNPGRNEEHRFRKGMPYAQLIVVPTDVRYRVTRMSAQDERAREAAANAMLTKRRALTRRRWLSDQNVPFDDLYRRLANAVRVKRGFAAQPDSSRRADERT